MEQWKDVKGFEGIYQISTRGRLKSFKKDPRGRILLNNNSKGDYLSVVLASGGNIRYTRIHRLVAETFIPNPKKLPEVNHRDHNRQNNRAENLEWTTRVENHRDALKHNPAMIEGMIYYNKFIRPRLPKNIRQMQTKHLQKFQFISCNPPIEQYTMDGKYMGSFNNAKEAERKTGVCSRNICQVVSREEYRPGKIRKQAGGYKWQYTKELQE